MLNLTEKRPKWGAERAPSRTSHPLGPGELTDGRDEGGVERVLAEAEQKTRLSNSAVSYEQELEEVIVGFSHLPRRSSYCECLIAVCVLAIPLTLIQTGQDEGAGLRHLTSMAFYGARIVAVEMLKSVLMLMSRAWNPCRRFRIKIFFPKQQTQNVSLILAFGSPFV